MKVTELNRDQLIILKQDLLAHIIKDVSYGELANADNIILDETIFKTYENTIFTEDDFKR